MPTRHLVVPWKMNLEERMAIMDTILRYQEKIVKSLAPGCDIKENYRPFVPQGKVKVDHIHWHLLPRFPEDKFDQIVGVTERTLWKEITQEELNKFKNLYVAK